MGIAAKIETAGAAAQRLGPRVSAISIGTNLIDCVALSGTSLYSASKSALTGMTRALARELGPQGITVNLVNPGSTDTDMNPAGGPGAAFQVPLSALGRFGSPDDIAAAVMLLAGPGGRSITGTSILVDSGANG